MPGPSYALTDDFSASILTKDIYNEASVCKPITIQRINPTSLQPSNDPLSHGFLLGMQCSSPRLVPIPIHHHVENGPRFMIWASVPKQTDTMKTIINTIDDAPITIVYDKQQNMPEIYKNWLFSDSHLQWKGNIVLLLEGQRLWRQGC